MKLISILIFFFGFLSFGQDIDTLSFYSEAFEEQRTIYVHKPEFYKYKSDSIKLPVIFLLDGQHEWFVDPILSDIRFLQYTHEIPMAIVVVIPHKNRNKECRLPSMHTDLPLDTFITQEINRELLSYNPSDFKIIIGHSFSASFSLYTYLKHPNYYTAVIANTPLEKMEWLIKSFQEDYALDKSNISISIGGSSVSKDYYHRRKYNELKEKYPNFFNTINTFEADNSAHNAVPLVSTPLLLTNIFKNFKGRYSHIAKVDEDYKLISKPEPPEKEIEKIKLASKIETSTYPSEIPEINGIASRYWNSDYEDIATKIYQLGIQYYPHYYDFYLSLYELTAPKDKLKAREYLDEAELLLKTFESQWDGKNKIIDDIKEKKG